jgi:hypothetical protein
MLLPTVRLKSPPPHMAVRAKRARYEVRVPLARDPRISPEPYSPFNPTACNSVGGIRFYPLFVRGRLKWQRTKHTTATNHHQNTTLTALFVRAIYGEKSDTVPTAGNFIRALCFPGLSGKAIDHAPNIAVTSVAAFDTSGCSCSESHR